MTTNETEKIQKNNINNTQENIFIDKKIIEKIYEIKKKISNLKKEQKDSYLRHVAKIENIKKENIKNIENIKKEISEKFFKRMLPIINAINYIDKKNKTLKITNHPIIEGIRLTKKEFKKVLNNWNIKKIDQINQPFNDKIHIINDTKSNPTEKKSNICKIIHPGYKINNLILQKAIVEIK